MVKEKEILTNEDVLKLIEKAKKEGKDRLFLNGKTLEELNLSYKKIDIGIELQNATILGIVDLVETDFGNRYLDLRGATLKKGLFGPKMIISSLYLQNTKIFLIAGLREEHIVLNHAEIKNWLVVHGMKFYTKDGKIIHPDSMRGCRLIRLAGVKFTETGTIAL